MKNSPARYKYIKQNWDMAIGLQQVDSLAPSQYLLDLAEDNATGNITYAEIEALLYQKYKSESPIESIHRQKEADIVSLKIARLLEEPSFSLNLPYLKKIHKELFDGIYDHAGKIRQCNLTKQEPILYGRSVTYADYTCIKENFTYDFSEEREQNYAKKTKQQIIARIARFTSAIWQTHPFMEGNTRTTAVFIEKYLNTIGFTVDNSLFAQKAKYFRNALVRSNFADYGNGIDVDYMPLEHFFDNLLFQGEHMLRNRDLIVTAYSMPQQNEMNEVERE